MIGPSLQPKTPSRIDNLKNGILVAALVLAIVVFISVLAIQQAPAHTAAVELEPRATRPAGTPTAAATTLAEQPPVAAKDLYNPPPTFVCEQLLAAAQEQYPTALLELRSPVPFLDQQTQETGTGCSITGSLHEPALSASETLDALTKNVGLGWTELQLYKVNQPDKSATALFRDSGLLLLTVAKPQPPEQQCDPGASLAACPPTPPGDALLINATVAVYSPGYSLDGLWRDEETGQFTLDITQEWKIVKGHHQYASQSGSPMDAMQLSILGTMNGRETLVTFQSSNTDRLGIALIEYIGNNQIHWKIISPPYGDHYLPPEANLVRK